MPKMPDGSIRLLNRNRRDLRMKVTVLTKGGKVVRTCRFTLASGGYDVQSFDDLGLMSRYWIDTTQGYLKWTCSCPDSEHRNPTSCKHVRALKKALLTLS